MNVQCTAAALIIRSLPSALPGTDTGKRFIRDQHATVYGESLDDAWLFVDAPAARGWVSRNFVAQSQDVLPTPAWPKIPNGYDEIVRVFGEHSQPLCSAGRVTLPVPLKLSWNDERVTVVACHKLMEDVFASVFKALHTAKLWTAVENFGGIYQPRNVKGGKKISTHAWGISVDIDTLDNALGDKTPEMDPGIIRIFEDHGFLWGGRWSRPDAMHFQRATGY